jgi:hypothetical protein
MTVRLHFDALLTGTVQGPQGETGPAGPTGATGAAGPTGPTGPAGEVAMPRVYPDESSGGGGSFGLNRNTRYLAVGSGNLAFELPVAADPDNYGAVISVTDLSGTVRDIVVSPASGESIHAPAGAGTMTAAYSSRTFVAIEGGGSIGPGWVITASVGA